MNPNATVDRVIETRILNQKLIGMTIEERTITLSFEDGCDLELNLGQEGSFEVHVPKGIEG